jgi:hypothetical protein
MSKVRESSELFLHRRMDLKEEGKLFDSPFKRKGQ